MRVDVVVKPNSKKPGIEKLPSGAYRVAVKAPAIEGRANEAVIAVLADHFGVPKSAIAIVRGLKGKKKVVEVGIGL